MIRTTTTAIILALAGSAVAQPAITFDIENDTLLPGQSTTVTMFAGFDPSDWAMNAVDTDLVTSVGSDGWSDAALPLGMAGPGTTAGVPSDTGYDGIIAGQLQFHSVYADPTNPIAFWSAVYTAPIDATAPFEIDLSTETRRYTVYVSRDSVTSVSRLADLTEGAATIHVIPAPASALVFALGAVAMRRRR